MDIIIISARRYQGLCVFLDMGSMSIVTPLRHLTWNSSLLLLFPSPQVQQMWLRSGVNSRHQDLRHVTPTLCTPVSKVDRDFEGFNISHSLWGDTVTSSNAEFLPIPQDAQTYSTDFEAVQEIQDPNLHIIVT
ncbi:hypothetical protein Avbf_00035 [Armadillidium vulgare]|nr:hypothetical protein Avbf_00035 [Armadillidium vulgare]